MKITVRPVDETNWEDIARLKLEADQAEFVASNAFSLAEAAYTENSTPLAIFAGEQAVGFVMYEAVNEEGREGEYKIYRFMVDKAHQGRGFGRKALERTVSAISAIPDCNRITICYVPGNEVARSFYESVGFTEVGLDEHGEMIAEIIIQGIPD